MALNDSQNMNNRALRDALGCFATGVGVITTATPGGHKMGLTVNSFSSLSLDPPLILWSLSLASGLSDHFVKGCPFVINFLHDGQSDLALKFATALEDRFKSIELRDGQGGAPIFLDNAGYLECITEAVYPGGDHAIIIGRVTGFEAGTKPPLIFHQGKFKSLTEGEAK